MDKNVCTCGARKGYKQVGDNWVCATCEKPSLLYMERVILPRTVLGQEKYRDLNLHLKAFSDRVVARVDQEIRALSEDTGLPEKYVRGMYDAARARHSE